MDENLVGGKGWAVGPDAVDRVKIDIEPDAGGIETGAQSGCLVDRHQHAVDAHLVALRKMFAKIFDNGRGVGQTVFHQHDSCAFDLLCALKEIAAVNPQEGFLVGHDHRSCRSGEPAEIADDMPVIRDIFTQMSVGAGEDHRFDAGFIHFLAERCDALDDTILHKYFI